MALATSDTQREGGGGNEQESLPPSHRKDA